MKMGMNLLSVVCRPQIHKNKIKTTEVSWIVQQWFPIENLPKSLKKSIFWENLFWVHKHTTLAYFDTSSVQCTYIYGKLVSYGKVGALLKSWHPNEKSH
jgi:hypothetical protein